MSRKSCAGEGHTPALLLLHSLLVTAAVTDTASSAVPPPRAPDPWNMPHDQPLAAELRSHSTLLGIGVPSVACIVYK